ncbi:MAG: AMMECR1 domain-containing protein, partial [Acidobacteria bacterium]|nr:AMMECR1 domain-containing protein [Acidobacteriota bacterium]NIQ31428.1 AMMECR1 domain-containing protein [Acidobacteriota bacterium]
FAPVRAEELGEISVEVSVLSPLVEIEHRDEEHLLSQLRPGIDGLVIAHDRRRAT